MFERVQIVAAADMHRPDEDLWHRVTSVRPREHLAAPLALARQIDLVEGTIVAAKYLVLR